MNMKDLLRLALPQRDYIQLINDGIDAELLHPNSEEREVDDYKYPEQVVKLTALYNRRSTDPGYQKPIELRPKLVYLHIGFAGSACQVAYDKIGQSPAFDFIICESWAELILQLSTPNKPPEGVLIHLDTVRNSSQSLADISKMISTALALNNCPGNNRVGIVVDDFIDIAFVKELRKYNILNIVPGVGLFGAKESFEATNALLQGIPYILKCVKPAVPGPKLPRVVSFRVEPQPPWDRTVKQQLLNNKQFDIEFCHSWNGLSELLKEPADLVLFHTTLIDIKELSATEIVNLISTMTQFSAGHPMKIAAVIRKTTTLEQIKELKKTNVIGIVPSSEEWGCSIGIPAVAALVKNASHWPRDIIDSLPRAIEVGAIVNPVTRPVGLTTRQQQVSDLVCKRGLSNKQIANSLKISESTVKIHVSAVMKMYGVRNRTQLVLATKHALTA